MKLKKLLAVIAACAMSATVLGMTVYAAGAQGDEETVPEEETEIEDGNEDEPEDEPEVTTNPQTGNSPIALAVIPVALAAAAVVAKKANK